MERVLKRLLLVLLLMLRAQAHAYTKGTNTVDLLTDYESGNPGDLVTASILFNGSHTNGQFGFWAVSTNQTLTITNLNNQNFRGPTIVNTTPFTGVGNSKTLVLDLKQNLTRQYTTWNFAANKTSVSVGFAFMFINGGASTGDLYDLFAFEGGGGANFYVLSVEQRTGNASKIGIETDVTTGGSGYKQFNDSTPYWITMRYNKNGNAEFRMYDMSTWNVYFQTNLTLNNVGVDTIYVGRYDAHNGNHPNDRVFYDNLNVDVTGVNYPLLPPGATVTAATTSWTDVSNAVYATSWGGNNRIYDVVSLPNSSNRWAGMMVITNTCMVRGTGTNGNQSVMSISAAVQAHGLDLNAEFIKLRDFQFTGVYGVASDGWGINFNANNCSCSNLLVQNFLSCVIANVPFGVMYNCTFRNASRIPGRFFGSGDGQANWDNYTPFNGTTDYAKTNFFVVEDSECVIDSAMDGAITGQPAVTSQQGALWVIRKCHFNYRIAYDLQPMFDSHGETDPGPLRGNIAIQVYSNHVDWISGSFDKFTDIRGGAALVYSNVVVGPTTNNCNVFMRKKHDETANYDNDPVTNCWFCANFAGASGTTAMPNVVQVTPVDDTSIIVEGIHFHQTCLSPLSAVPYPHPLRNELDSGGGGGTPVNPARFTRIRLTK